MGRPRMPIGSHGTFNFVQVGAGWWRARTLVRFPDGTRRQVQRKGPSKAKATAALQEALLMLSAQAATGLRSTMTLRIAADRFLEEKREAGLSVTTIGAYEQAVRSTIAPRIGDLRLSEATPSRLQAFLTTVTKEHGPGTAKMSRSVLSGIFGLAVRDDAVRVNPVQQIAPIRKTRPRTTVALPLNEVSDFIALLLHDAELQRSGAGEVFAFMTLTGCRIGEALALAWASVELDTSKVTFDATTVRVPAQGLLRQEHGKTHASTRTISIPSRATELLASRERLGVTVFSTATGQLRDPVAVELAWRQVRDRLGYPKLTSHALRKTVATGLDESGRSARAIAEYLGHAAPSLTQDVYMSRNVGSEKLAKSLDRMFGLSSDLNQPGAS